MTNTELSKDSQLEKYVKKETEVGKTKSHKPRYLDTQENPDPIYSLPLLSIILTSVPSPCLPQLLPAPTVCTRLTLLCGRCVCFHSTSCDASSFSYTTMVVMVTNSSYCFNFTHI